jgi:hypothetical protein
MAHRGCWNAGIFVSLNRRKACFIFRPDENFRRRIMKALYWVGAIIVITTLFFAGPSMIIQKKMEPVNAHALTTIVTDSDFVKDGYKVDKFARMDGVTFYRVIDNTYDFGGGPELIYIVTSNSSSKTVAISNPK